MKNDNIIAAIQSGYKTRDDIAEMYQQLFTDDNRLDKDLWKPINQAIENRWSSNELDYIKTLAHKIHRSLNPSKYGS